MVKQIRINDNLIVSQDFFEFLSNTGGLVPAMILNLNTDPSIGYISVTEKPDMVSYLPMNKFRQEPDFDPFSNSSRTHLRIGRLINKLIPQEIAKKHNLVDAIIEQFTNQYKSWFDRSNVEFRVVEGEEIRKWYWENHYFRPNGMCIGTLWNSCMRYRDRLKYLDMYCSNPDIKMLVMIDYRDGQEKVRSRALLWEKVQVLKSNGEVPSEIKVMDRIYSTFDSDVLTFKKWAADHGYVPKFEQNSKSHQTFDVKGNPVILTAKVVLSNYQFGSYPYLDTFPFFNIMKGELYNNEFLTSWSYKLVQANGLLEREPEPDDEVVEEEWDD